jgi:ABC-type lipoprotein release transport system permease subunit
MRAMWGTFEVVIEIALRNLFASKWKTLIVGGIIGFGAFLIVVGMSLVDGVDHAMRRSVTGSLSGHIQVYSSKSKDDLDLMGGFGGNGDIEPLTDFAKVRSTLLSVPNVKAVVPMGVNNALVSSGNTVDQLLSNLRLSVNAIEQHKATPEIERRYQAQKAHVRQMVEVLRRELDNAKEISERQQNPDDVAAIAKAASPEFWDSFDSARYDHLELLENKIAPLSSDADLVQLRYVGTDPQAFAAAFDRMKIVDGQAIPEGQRGFLFSKYMYEEAIKLKTARGLDKLQQALDDRGQKIATDPDLQRIVRENTSGVRELLLQLDPISTESFRKKLQGFLHSQENDVGKLLAAFFKTDDKNFHERYRFFYDALAPELELYRVRIGDTLMVKAFTKSGYVQSANLKVYGTYTFQGLEKSPQAGAMNMMDLVSFRELFGFMTEERAKEIAAMRKASGAKDLKREDAEAELFGSRPTDDSAPAADSGDTTADELASLRGTRAEREAPGHDRYDPRELREGATLSVAVIVRDEGKLEQTIRDIEAAGKKAGLPLKAITWQKAAGIIGQFTTLMRAVLFSAVLIIFVVALVVINNALVMATLERVREIGTLRAVGAQKRFVLVMLLLESLVIGSASGLTGAILGCVLLFVLGRVGIPATTEQLSFFFSGPRLYPSVGAPELLFALVTVLAVSLISSIYPAWLAMRVSPREAMQSEE